MAAGPQGPLQSIFEDGLRLLAAALAIRAGRRPAPAAVTAACDAIRCFLKILEAAGARHLPDPGGDVARLKAQCEALLTPRQAPEDALAHVLEAARLARDAAARVLVLLPPAHPGGGDG
ncbi:MAG: hypothetical protein ABSH53_24485 [Holophaga sp.]|jgi:hypothetical protein